MSVITVTKSNFEQEVLGSSVPVLVDFWAPWCGPCRMIGPLIDELAQEADERYKVGKINVDEQPELAAKFGVMSIPTLIVFKNGTLHEKKIGLQGKDALLAMLLS